MSKQGKRAKRSRPEKEIPRFRNEDEEREFWATHDSTDYVDWRAAKPVLLARLKPSTETISLRLPESLLNELRVLANQRDVPYQSLLKIFLAERIQMERRRKAG
jgi:predicted DNA binding CopG/RHH family protein